MVQRNDDGLLVRLRWSPKDGKLRHLIDVADKFGGFEYTEAYSEADQDTPLKVTKLVHAKRVYDLVMRQMCGDRPTDFGEWNKMIAINRDYYSKQDH